VKRLIAAAVVGGAVALAVPAHASPPNPVPVTVTVTHDNGGVQFGTGLGSQPLFGGKADNTGICGSFSKQMPFCLPVKPSN
jgi:hypothetical protein